MNLSKRILVFLIVAACVSIIVHWGVPEKVRSSEIQKDRHGSGSKVVVGFGWDRELRERPDRDSLDSLRGRLLAMTSAGAVAEISAFLQSGKDRDAGLEFEIGAGGAMKGWPTLRVFLLDLLLGIDPAAAARISREILATSTTADEWAISLRNVARGEADGDTRDYLRAKAEELITNSGWQAKPSVGYLNAFDVLVHTDATESTALLSGLIQQKERRDLAHAGFLTLDRLVQRQPLEMLIRIQSDLALQKSRPEMTAQQFARADLRDGPQQAVVKSWLLDPTRTPTELHNFASTYPNNNRMVSQNLLTSEDSVAGADLATHDRGVLEIIRHWKTEPGFETLSRYLEIMDGRVSGFVKGADGSR